MGVVSTMYVSEGFGVGGGQDMCDAHKEDELVTGGQGKSTTICDYVVSCFIHSYLRFRCLWA